MGFYLWLDGDLAWAEGTYEYRAMGGAVISRNDMFHPRDFSRRRKAPDTRDPSYVGQFASIGQINTRLREERRSAAIVPAPELNYSTKHDDSHRNPPDRSAPARGARRR